MCVATRLAARLPMVGPSAQKPMAAPRPIWGEKSRMSAGVDTRMIPSTNPMTQYARAKPNLEWMWGTPSSCTKATTSVP